MSDTENGNKVVKLGLVPVAKIATVCPQKAWAAYQQSLKTLTEAKEAAAVAKEAVLTAMVGKLKIEKPETVSFWANHERVVLYRKPKEKKQRASELRDLTAG